MAKYSYEFKMKVVQAYLNGEGWYTYLANKYNIPAKCRVAFGYIPSFELREVIVKVPLQTIRTKTQESTPPFVFGAKGSLLDITIPE